MSDANGNGVVDLSALLRAVCDQEGVSMRKLTVLAPANDPYRVDTPLVREAGEWFAEHWHRLGERPAHGRRLAR